MVVLAFPLATAAASLESSVRVVCCQQANVL